MSIFTKAADFVQRGMVLGLFTFFGFQAYQIGANVWRGKVDSPYMHSTYFQDVEEKVKEENKKARVTVDEPEGYLAAASRRDMYPEDDDSYLKDQVRANITRPEFKKQYDEQHRK